MPAGRIALYVASLGGLALAARAVLGAPPPLWLAVTAMLAYATLATLGVLIPQLGMYGDVRWRGEPGTRGVALSFDDGPHPDTTPRVLDALSAAGVKATFFVIGSKAEIFPELVQRIHAEGHTVGVHGYTHDRLYSWLPPKRARADLMRAIDVVERLIDERPRFFRPPIGHVSSRVAKAAGGLSLVLVAWTTRARDGLGTTDDEAVRARLERGLRDGAILALHDAAERDDHEPASVRVLPDLLSTIAARGVTVVPLGELLGEEAYFATAPRDEKVAEGAEVRHDDEADGAR